jgi:hypothetical protein
MQIPAGIMALAVITNQDLELPEDDTYADLLSPLDAKWHCLS